MDEPSAVVRRRTVLVSSALLALTLIHDVDHVRQGRSLSWQLWSVGALALVATATTVALAIRGHHLMGAAAIVLGVGTVIGVGAIHAAPTWWFMSDSYVDTHVDAISWAIIIAMMFTGSILGLMGISTFQRSAKESRGLPTGSKLGP